ncbi:MAG: hypothetical protein ACE5JS_03675 [Nitrospinota bacterium]
MTPGPLRFLQGGVPGLTAAGLSARVYLSLLFRPIPPVRSQRSVRPHKAARSALRAALPGLRAREIWILPVSQLRD